jgi:formate C-acetyltransferase
MGRVKLDKPDNYVRLSQAVTDVFRLHEESDPSLARAMALRHVVENCPIELEPDALLAGGENPFFFNLMHGARNTDRYAREFRDRTPDDATDGLRRNLIINGPTFEGHITPGLEYILGQGISGLEWRVREHLRICRQAHPQDLPRHRWYEALLAGCQSVRIFTRRLRQRATELAKTTYDSDFVRQLTDAAEVLARVPENPAQTFHDALQSYWIVYTLVTLEMGGCTPGGGLGLGRLDQSLYPYYRRDIEQGRLARGEALELMEIFLLGFRHIDYHTSHQQYTPGSQTSLGGVTPTGQDASNELTELIMEASLRIANPAPYVSLRLHKLAPERYWQAAANYVIGGLGFPVVNDEVLIPSFMRHGRSLGDARDYICSCCYENTIPGREAFHPNGGCLNLPGVLELALNEGRMWHSGLPIGVISEPATAMKTFDEVLAGFRRQLHHVCDRMVDLINRADEAHCAHRRYPLMSLLMEDCIANGKDVCAGGARYNLTGCIAVGLPTTVNSLAAIRHCIFETGSLTLGQVLAALKVNFQGHEDVRRQLLAAPKWGNGDARVDDLARAVSDMLYDELAWRSNPRGGRWQAALYSFTFNHDMGKSLGASADGRAACTLLARNLNPAWGTDNKGPTAVLQSLSRIEFDKFPNGSALDLRFDPSLFADTGGRKIFAAFLKGFVDLGVMEMQVSMVNTQTLLDARADPQKYPDLMVKVAGYSARFVDLSEVEKDELIGRTTQRLD